MPENLLLKVANALSRGDTVTLNEVLQLIHVDDLTLDLNRGLLSNFADDDDLLHEMYGLLHTIERSSPDVLYLSVAAEIESMHARAPFWTGMIIGRLLNASAGVGQKHDFNDFIKTMKREASSSGWAVFLKIARQLVERGKVRSRFNLSMLEDDIGP